MTAYRVWIGRPEGGSAKAATATGPSHQVSAAIVA